MTPSCAGAPPFRTRCRRRSTTRGEELGDDRIDSLAPLEVEPDEGTTRVVLQFGADEVEVTVRDRMSDPLLSQCSATDRRPRADLRVGVDEPRLTPCVCGQAGGCSCRRRVAKSATSQCSAS